MIVNVEMRANRFYMDETDRQCIDIRDGHALYKILDRAKEKEPIRYWAWEDLTEYYEY